MEQLEEDDFLLEDDENNLLDDLLVEAQDAYFENNLPSVIEICDKILAAQPNERETYQLLTLSLFQSFPPQYQRAIDVAQRWAKNCQTNINQLTILMRASYHTNQTKLLKDVSRDISSKLARNQDTILQVALASALLSDIGESEYARSIFGKLEGIVDIADLDMQIMENVRLKALNAWIYASSSDTSSKDKGTEALQQLTTSSHDSSAPSIGLASALLILHAIEHNNLSHAEELLTKAQQNATLSKDENILCVQALHKTVVNGKPSEEDVRIATLAAPTANDIIKKRVEHKILFLK